MLQLMLLSLKTMKTFGDSEYSIYRLLIQSFLLGAGPESGSVRTSSTREWRGTSSGLGHLNLRGEVELHYATVLTSSLAKNTTEQDYPSAYTTSTLAQSSAHTIGVVLACMRDEMRWGGGENEIYVSNNNSNRFQRADTGPRGVALQVAKAKKVSD